MLDRQKLIGYRWNLPDQEQLIGHWWNFHDQEQWIGHWWNLTDQEQWAADQQLQLQANTKKLLRKISHTINPPQNKPWLLILQLCIIEYLSDLELEAEVQQMLQ